MTGKRPSFKARFPELVKEWQDIVDSAVNSIGDRQEEWLFEAEMDGYELSDEDIILKEQDEWEERQFDFTMRHGLTDKQFEKVEEATK